MRNTVKGEARDFPMQIGPRRSAGLPGESRTPGGTGEGTRAAEGGMTRAMVVAMMAERVQRTGHRGGAQPG